jgi:2-keto-3-deoxy-L-rhamnonate aldolase RhmA
VPRVNSAADAEAALRAAWYPPHGSRGMCPDVRASRYDMTSWTAYAQTIRDEIAVIPLIEDRAALHEIEAIVAVDGIDAVFFGPGDFGVSIGAATTGFTAEIEAESMAALRHISKAAAHHEVSLIATPLSGLMEPDKAIEALVDAGVTGIMYSTDTMVFHAAARAVAETFQRRMGTTEAPQAKTA